MRRGHAPRQPQPRPPTFKAQPASSELTPQPEPVGGRPGHGFLGTQEPSGPDGQKELRPRPAPPGSRRRCPVSVCWPGGLRTGGATGAGYAHASIMRADPRPRAHALRASTRPQPSTITWADPARHLLGSPGTPTAPWLGYARGRVYTAYRPAAWPAGGATSRQNKHPLPRFLLPRLGPPA